jgi:hypothetical protein
MLPAMILDFLSHRRGVACDAWEQPPYAIPKHCAQERWTYLVLDYLRASQATPLIGSPKLFINLGAKARKEATAILPPPIIALGD